MKYLYRKPLLPILLLTMLLFGTCFMTLYQKGMAEDRQRIEEIYNNTHIYIEALPEDDNVQTLRMVVHRGDMAASLEEIADSMVMLQCYYALRSPSQNEVYSTIYGTNHPDALAKYQSFSINWGEGFNRETFLDTEKQTACLMDETLAETLGLSIGDCFEIAPTVNLGEKAEDAPERTLTLAGTFIRKQSGLEQNSLIVPNTSFMAEGGGGLLYNASMMNHCFYRVYQLELNPAYNREVDVVLEKIENKLIDKYNLVSNARTMRQAIRPIEQKLQLQEMLEMPLMVVFSIATIVVGLLLALSLKTEIFLRFLVGERRFLVFLKMLGSLLFILLLFAAMALCLVRVTAGAEWVLAALNYLKFTTIFTFLAMALPLAVMCSENLIKLYQQREG